MRTVFFDVDTQVDFLFPAGALAVPDAKEIIGNLSRLTLHAAANDIQIISTADAHSENDPEFRIWKPHCVVGTTGQQKPTATLLGKPVRLSGAEGSLDRVVDLAETGGQIIVEKQQLDCFSNPNLRLLLDLVQADRYVVYGVVSELCVQCAAFGLLKTGARVELVTDAIKGLSLSDERKMIERFGAQGGFLTTTLDVS